MSPFSNEIKHQIRERQDNHCALCGKRVDLNNLLQCYHSVPENALLPLGIRGKCNVENGVGLCNPNEHGCHDLANKKAINEKLFLKDGQFVPLTEIDPKQYELTKKVNIETITKDNEIFYKIKKEERKEKRKHQLNIKRRRQNDFYDFDPSFIDADLKMRKYSHSDC